MTASIYREEILDHYKHPRNFGALAGATARAEEDNIPCGDHISVALKTSETTMEDIAFEGNGCALSIAAASMLTEKVKCRPLTEVENFKESDILEWVGGKISSGRLQCVLLGWKTLKKALANAQAGKTRASANGMLVTRDMNLGEIAARWPAARTTLLDYGLHCVGCFASSFDTLEAGAKVHGMSEEEIEEMVEEINAAVGKAKV